MSAEMDVHVDSTFGEDGEYLGEVILVYNARDEAYWAAWDNVGSRRQNAVRICRGSM